MHILWGVLLSLVRAVHPCSSSYGYDGMPYGEQLPSFSRIPVQNAGGGDGDIPVGRRSRARWTNPMAVVATWLEPITSDTEGIMDIRVKDDVCNAVRNGADVRWWFSSTSTIGSIRASLSYSSNRPSSQR